MMNEPKCKVAYMTIIAERKKSDALLASLFGAGGRLINIVYGKGSVKASYVRDVLGLVPEENKIVITSLIPDEKVNSILEMLAAKFRFDQPNTGIAYTIPVERLSL